MLCARALPSPAAVRGRGGGHGHSAARIPLIRAGQDRTRQPLGAPELVNLKEEAYHLFFILSVFERVRYLHFCAPFSRYHNRGPLARSG